MARFLYGFVFGILAVIAAGAAVVFSGVYNVAASVPHTPIETLVFSTTMRHSVARRAADIVVPAEISADQVRRGFAQFRESCVYCHGAPGVDATDWAQGITPEPPFLPDTLRGRPPQELFWIVRNGIKMTAMPSFGRHLDDQTIWGIVGFIRQLPDMSAEDYARLAREAEAGGN